MFSSDSEICSVTACFDWLYCIVSQLRSQFPLAHEQAILNNLTRLAIHRHVQDSSTCGVFDLLAGRMIYCVTGVRLYLGMSIERIVALFEQAHTLKPKSLKICAAWIKELPLEDILSNGFYCLLGEGDILAVPPCFMIFEACLGTDGCCDVISWPFLQPEGHEWKVGVDKLRRSGLLSVEPSDADSHFAKMIHALQSGIDLLEKVVLLSNVKIESEELPEKPDPQLSGKGKGTSGRGQERPEPVSSKLLADKERNDVSLVLFLLSMLIEQFRIH